MNNLIKKEVVNYFFKKHLHMEVNNEVALHIYKTINKFKNEACLDLFLKNVVTDIHNIIKYDNTNYREWIDRFYYNVVSYYDDQRIELLDMLDDYLSYSDKEWIINALLYSEGSYENAKSFYVDNAYGTFVFLDEMETFCTKKERILECLECDTYNDFSDPDKLNELYNCIKYIHKFIYAYNTGEYRVTKWFNTLKNVYDYYVLENVKDGNRLILKNLNKHS